MKILNKIISILIVFELIFPVNLLAQNQSPQFIPSSSETSDIQQDHNLFKLLDQKIIKKSDPSVSWELSSSNVAKPEVFTPTVKFRNLKEVSFTGSHLQISYSDPKAIYIQDINMDENISKVLTDDDMIIILTESNTLYAIDIFFLSQTIFVSPCPVFKLGTIPTLEEDTRLYFIKRRIKPLDKRVNTEQLSMSPSKNSKLLDESTPVDLEILEEEFNEIRYIPLTEELRQDSSLIRSGDLALIKKDPSTGISYIYRIIPRSILTLEMNYQMIFYAKIQSLALDPNFINNIDSIESLSLKEINDLFREYNLASSISEDKNVFLKSIQHISYATIWDDFRDVFTEKEWENDSIFFETLISSIKKNAPTTKIENSSFLSKVINSTKEAIKGCIKATHINKLVSLISNKYVLSTLVFTLSSIYYTKLYPDSSISLFITENFSKVQNYILEMMFSSFPVLNDASYRSLLGYSIFWQLFLMFSIYFIARIIAPFTQHKYETLPPLLGAKIFKNFFIISPFRLLAKITRQIPIFLALKKGYLPNGALPILDSNNRDSMMNEITKDISTIKNKTFLINILLTKSLYLMYLNSSFYNKEEATDTSRLKQFLERSEVKTKIEKLRTILISYLQHIDLEQIDQKDFFEKLDTLIRTVDNDTSIDLDNIYEKEYKQYQDESNTSSTTSRTTNLNKFIALIFNYNESLYQSIAQGSPNNFTSTITKRQFFTNYTLSVFIQAIAGDLADPTHPDQLMARQGSLFYSSPAVNVFNFQKILGHLGKSAITTNLIFQEENQRVNVEYYPAELIDLVEKDINFSKYPFLKEMFIYGKNILNFREAEPAKLSVRWLIKSSIVLLQASLIIGCIFRVAFGNQTLYQAVLGILTFMACSAYLCNWPWSFLTSSQYLHDNNTKNKYQEFITYLVMLKQGIRLKQYSDIKQSFHYFFKAYTTTYLDIDKETMNFIRQNLDPNTIDSLTEEQLENISFQLEKIIQNQPPVVRHNSELVSFIYTAIASLTAAFLLSFLITTSFKEDLSLFNIEKSIFDINMFTHIPNDGVVILILKSTVLAYMLYASQDIFNCIYDYIRYKLTPSSEEYKELKEKRLQNLENSKTVLANYSIVKAINKCRLFFMKEKPSE